MAGLVGGRRSRLVQRKTQARATVNPYRIHEYTQGTVETVPDIMEFIVSDRYLNRPNLYPRQATMLKTMFLQTETFTDFDFHVLGEWEETFLRTGYEGVSPGILERIEINKAQGRKWFRETQGVIGRRGSKGYIGGLAGAYVTWNFMLVPGGPQHYYGIDRDKRLTGIVFAGKKEQAMANQWKDLTNVMLGATCFSPYISRSQTERLTIFAPTDVLRSHRMDTLGVNSDTDLASFEIIPAPSTTMAARGPTSYMQHYDEQAHVLSSTANADAGQVYQSAVPSLDQFKKDGFIYAPSSPWAKTGQFYENWQLAIEMNPDGSPAYPERLMFQLPSWGTYLDWERAGDLPLRPAKVTLIDIGSETSEMVSAMAEVSGLPPEQILAEIEAAGGQIEEVTPDPLGNFQPLRTAIQTYDDDMRQLERANPETFAVERRCLDPDTRVLTGDLRWVRIDDLNVGDELVSIEETGKAHAPGHYHKRRERTLQRAIVEAKADSYDEAYRIEFDDGTSVVCSGKHRWFSASAGSRTCFRWRSIEPPSAVGPRTVMKIGDQIRAIVEPWEEDSSWDAGWLSGMYDGEGCVINRTRRRTEFRIDLAQNPGAVHDKAFGLLEKMGFRPRDASTAGRKCRTIKVTGLSSCIRLLGQLRPLRLLQNGNPTMWEGRALGHENGLRFTKTITSITPLPRQRLVDIQTSTGTFIAEGLISHNSRWSESLAAYLNAAKVEQIFAPWRGETLFCPPAGVLDVTYIGRGDPANTNKRFGWALGHKVWVPHEDPEKAAQGEGRNHVVFDRVTCWEPADYPDHLLDYDDVIGDIWTDIVGFQPEDVAFDQFNVPATIGNIRKRLIKDPQPKQVRVREITRTRQLNWRHYELFKAAINLGLVHAPSFWNQPDPEHESGYKANYASGEAEKELRFLEERNGAVDHPTSGPVQTKDIADCMCEVVVGLIGEELAEALGESLAALGIGGAAQGGTDPTRHQIPPEQRQIGGKFDQAISRGGMGTSTGAGRGMRRR